MVVMMAMVQRNPQLPGPIGLSLHLVKVGTPIIEIADHRDRLRFWSDAEKVDRLGHVPGRVTVVVAVRLARMRCVQGLHLVQRYPLESRFQQVSR